MGVTAKADRVYTINEKITMKYSVRKIFLFQGRQNAHKRTLEQNKRYNMTVSSKTARGLGDVKSMSLTLSQRLILNTANPTSFLLRRNRM